MSKLEILDDEMKTAEYYNMCLLSCKNKIFCLSNLDDKVLLKGDASHKSISMIAETLKVLRLDLGYDNEYVSRVDLYHNHITLLYTSYIGCHNLIIQYAVFLYFFRR